MNNAPHVETTPVLPTAHRATIERARDERPSAAAMRGDPMDLELRALRAKLDELLIAAPGMAAWVERVAVWEFDHRDIALVTQ